MSKKFKIKVEKLTEQLNGLRAENNELKSQLLDSGCVKVDILNSSNNKTQHCSRITEMVKSNPLNNKSQLCSKMNKRSTLTR